MISNTSELYDIWSELPIPIYMQFYMFNLSNPEEVKQGRKPYVVQKGPYTYRQVKSLFSPFISMCVCVCMHACVQQVIHEKGVF